MSRNKDDDLNLGKYENIKSKSLSGANIGLWIMENKKNLILGVIIVLGVASLFLYSFFFYNLFDYLKHSKTQRQALNELANMEVVTSQRGALPVEILEEKYFSQRESYDFLAKVKNPNDNFFARPSYCFVDGDKELACASNTIFPGEEKYLIILSKKIETSLTGVELKIKNTSWERVDVRRYPDWNDYYNLRTNIDINNIKFEKNAENPGAILLDLSFDLKNNSPYNYWSVPLQIVLFNRGTVMGVNSYKVAEFRSGDFRDIQMSWPAPPSTIDSVKVFLDLDVLDEDNYIKYR